MNTYNLFISHSWTYEKQYDGLVSLLDNRSYFRYKNYSIPKDDPIHTKGTDKELRNAIRKKIKNSHAVLILAGVYATYSKWIKIEIDIATNDFSKKFPIIAIEPWGSERTSQYVKDRADEIAKWNTESIVHAIRNMV